ncbi:hypothetical protein DZA33_01525 [bacterium HD9-500m-PIT-SAG08]|nr:hypothetical protein DZA33_01525 [bacterium HD9-500m-PIT-SAG08]
MVLKDCYNFNDFRNLAKKKLPSPIFHYIDGGADDETTLKRNTEAFNQCDLVPNILASVGKPDLSTIIFGKKIDMPIFLSPCAMQRLYHHDGDKASARAAEKFGTFYSMSTMANNTIEEISNISGGPKLFQLYVHKDQSITDDLIDRCKRSGFNGRVYSTDVCLPISNITECVNYAEEQAKKFGLRAPMVGHLGDGNFHVLLPFDPEKKEMYKKIREFNDLLINKALDLKGTITGEHGVGLHKKEYLLKEHGDNIPVMKLIKRSIDQNNIMNPGKIFDLN